MATLTDTHCHLNFDAFDADRDAVLMRAREAGVQQVIVPAADLATARSAAALAAQHDGLYFAAGVHPVHTAAASDADYAAIADIVAHHEPVAIGEIGLDYHWDTSPPDVQRAALLRQLALARSAELPVIIHNREATADVLALLVPHAAKCPPSLRGRVGVLHSFSGSLTDAMTAIDAGFYVGFTGPVTFKNADALREVVRAVPLERLLIETDSPYLAPVPYRGQRNEPAYVAEVAARIAQERGISVEELAAHTTENARILFDLPAAR